MSCNRRQGSASPQIVTAPLSASDALPRFAPVPHLWRANLLAMGICDVCGFGFSTVSAGEVAKRVSQATSEVIRVLDAATPEEVSFRPDPERWSALEYGAHVRDVHITIRDRIVIGLVEDDPSFKSLYRDERIELGLYAQDTVVSVSQELAASAGMFGRLFDSVATDALSRSVQYGFPNPQPRTILWMGIQAVHETDHHLTDIKENLEQAAESLS